MNVINWSNLARAVEHYRREGFEYLELPWSADPAVCAVTCPEDWRMFPFAGEVLVGSSEQSFMEAQFKGRLPRGRYVACTPCFRNEPVLDATHQRHFMKVELYVSGGTSVEHLARTARSFMETLTDRAIELVKTDTGYDLEIGGIEVGSYSTRENNGEVWTCATGLAEPRFSHAVSVATSDIDLAADRLRPLFENLTKSSDRYFLRSGLSHGNGERICLELLTKTPGFMISDAYVTRSIAQRNGQDALYEKAAAEAAATFGIHFDGVGLYADYVRLPAIAERAYAVLSAVRMVSHQLRLPAG
jgi:hypothetical protein